MSSKPTLRRAVTPWGSFSWGYSDVGADIFVGLGLVLGAAAGASNVAGAGANVGMTAPTAVPPVAALAATDVVRIHVTRLIMSSAAGELGA